MGALALTKRLKHWVPELLVQELHRVAVLEHNVIDCDHSTSRKHPTSPCQPQARVTPLAATKVAKAVLPPMALATAPPQVAVGVLDHHLHRHLHLHTEENASERSKYLVVNPVATPVAAP